MAYAFLNSSSNPLVQRCVQIFQTLFNCIANVYQISIRLRRTIHTTKVAQYDTTDACDISLVACLLWLMLIHIFARLSFFNVDRSQVWCWWVRVSCFSSLMASIAKSRSLRSHRCALFVPTPWWVQLMSMSTSLLKFAQCAFVCAREYDRLHTRSVVYSDLPYQVRGISSRIFGSI